MFKETFKITNNSIIIAIPWIIFIKIIDIYQKFVSQNADSNIKSLLALLTIALMTGAFLAAFFYMIKQAVEIHNQIFVLEKDRTNKILEIFKQIPNGIAQYFLPFTGVYVISIIIEVLTFPIFLILGFTCLGAPSDELINSFKALANYNITADAFINGLTNDQITYLGGWFLILIVFALIYAFLMLFWIPEIMYKSKNSLLSLFTSIGKVFKKFLKTLGIFLFICTTAVILIIIQASLPQNVAFAIICNILWYYVGLYFVFLIFLFYDKEFNSTVKNEPKEED